MKISSTTSYDYFIDLVGEFRPRRPFSSFFVSRLYSLDDMETGGFELSPIANVSLYLYKRNFKCVTNIPTCTATVENDEPQSSSHFTTQLLYVKRAL